MVCDTAYFCIDPIPSKYRPVSPITISIFSINKVDASFNDLEFVFVFVMVPFLLLNSSNPGDN